MPNLANAGPQNRKHTFESFPGALRFIQGVVKVWAETLAAKVQDPWHVSPAMGMRVWAETPTDINDNLCGTSAAS